MHKPQLSVQDQTNLDNSRVLQAFKKQMQVDLSNKLDQQEHSNLEDMVKNKL